MTVPIVVKFRSIFLIRLPALPALEAKTQGIRLEYPKNAY